MFNCVQCNAQVSASRTVLGSGDTLVQCNKGHFVKFAAELEIEKAVSEYNQRHPVANAAAVA